MICSEKLPPLTSGPLAPETCVRGPPPREQRNNGLWRLEPMQLMPTPKNKVKISEEMCAEEPNVVTDHEN